MKQTRYAVAARIVRDGEGMKFRRVNARGAQRKFWRVALRRRGYAE